MTTLANRASGIFLWIRIVVDSLIQGCNAYEDAKALKSRPVGILADFSRLYEYLLPRLETRHK